MSYENDANEEERYNIIHEFIVNNDEVKSKKQHFKDAREFLVPITNYEIIFSKLRGDAISYIKMNKITNKEDQLRIMKKTLHTNDDFNTIRLELKQFCNKFLQKDRDEYSLVKKIIIIYNYNEYKNVTYQQIRNIKNHLELYLTDDIETMSNGDKNEIDEYYYLKQLSLLMKNRNN
jgi:hypothetical protein